MGIFYRKMSKAALIIAILLCVVMCLCWMLFVTPASKVKPLEIVKQGINEYHLGDGIVLRADIVRTTGEYAQSFSDDYLHYTIVGSDGTTYQLEQLGVGILSNDPRKSDAEPFLGIGSCVFELDGRVIVLVSETDFLGKLKDSVESEIVWIGERYAYDLVGRIGVKETDKGVTIAASRLFDMQGVVLDEIPSNYELYCGDETLTALDIAELLQLAN